MLLPKEATELMSLFLKGTDQGQRDIFDNADNRRAATNIVRVLFSTVEKVKGDNHLVLYALAHLDGILEDSRARVARFISLLNDINKPMNLIKILNDFIDVSTADELAIHRDIASHILALLIEEINFATTDPAFGRGPAEDFLNTLVRSRNKSGLTPQAHTFALMTILK